MNILKTTLYSYKLDSNKIFSYYEDQLKEDEEIKKESELELKIKEKDNEKLKDEKIIKLEDIINSKRKKNNYIFPIISNSTKKTISFKNEYPKYNNQISSSNHIDPTSKAQVFYVPSSQLPPNVLGRYHIPSHTIYIANNLSQRVKNFVYHHEVAHAIGIMNESQADAYAERIVGYNIDSYSLAS
jgi:hypothetical protein